MPVTTTTVASLVASILTEGSFDATNEQALGWLDQRHRLLCARSRCLRKRLEVGPTVAGQQAYALPLEVMEIREVLVESSPQTGALGVPYGAGLQSDLAQGALGYLWLGGLFSAVGGGIYVRDEGSDGTDQVALYPTPEEAGRAITVVAVCRPAPLELAGHVSTPPEFDDFLLAGAIATGLDRLEGRPDLAAPGEAKFAGACAELEKQVNKRFRGAGPATIRVRGVNAS